MVVTEKELEKIIVTFQNLIKDCFQDIYSRDAVKGKKDMSAIAKTLELFTMDCVEETVRRHYKLASLLK